MTYAYTGDGALYSVTAEKDGAETRYIYGYDSLGRLISSEWKDNGASVLRTRQGYDDTNRLVTQSWQLGSDVYTEGFTYNSTQDGSLNTHTTATGQTLTMGYDELRRLSSVTGGIYGKTFTYRDISDTKTTTQVSSVVYDLPTDLTYGYTYDILGNIATSTDANGTVTYSYDAQGQLLSATNGSTTYSYTYDTVGNILTANGHTYTYGDSVWKDLLTAYDGQSITYDASGNPTSYYNGTRWTFGWTNGRRLATATNGTTNLSYTYDTDGLRTSKTVDGVKHTYLYAGGKLLRETYGNNTLDFFYDNAGSPYALKYNGTTYYYITNLQGDVMHLVNADGTVVASYEYDPYGNITSSSGDLAAVNPLRYRGYYYDTDTGLYYVSSRYYDPEIGRFINADAFPSTGQGITGNNMFAYCGNNPVTRTDIGGYFWDTVFDVASLVFSVVEVINNPDDVGAWVGLVCDVVDVAIPFVGGLGEAARAANAVMEVADTVDDLHDAKKVVKAVHGNSLDYPGINYGYVLSDKTTGEIVKFGESINPTHRYTKNFLNGENPINRPLDMTVVISGTKQEVHIWQHEQIVDFYEVVGSLPALNKSTW